MSKDNRFFATDFSRRQMVRSLVGGSMLMPGILSEVLGSQGGGGLAPQATLDPLSPRQPHFPAKAKRVIMLYMQGAMSQVDSFDPKPRLMKDHGKPVPADPHAKRRGGAFLRPFWDFKRGGKCGTPVSDLFPYVREMMDDITVIRSMTTTIENHPEATLGFHTGSFALPRPSLGSWVSYGLGTFNQNLPSFVVIAPKMPWGGGFTWGSDFLPPVHSGTRVIPGDQPILDLKSSAPSVELQQMELGMLEAWNRKHLNLHHNDVALAARIKSYETAFGMQMEAPEAFDLSKETDATHSLYGLERGKNDGFAWQCMVGRRLLERGVRFVELIDRGAGSTSGYTNWDAHEDVRGHKVMALNVDQSIAGLLKDLKSRGMLEDTLVIEGTEFGRQPWSDNDNDGGIGPLGRGHHRHAFSLWMAGAGVKKGHIHGATDDYGINVVQDEVHVHDLHATILHLLGFDHTKLTYRYGGRDFRLTDVHGKVVQGVLS